MRRRRVQAASRCYGSTYRKSRQAKQSGLNQAIELFSSDLGDKRLDEITQDDLIAFYRRALHKLTRNAEGGEDA